MGLTPIGRTLMLRAIFVALIFFYLFNLKEDVVMDSTTRDVTTKEVLDVLNTLRDTAVDVKVVAALDYAIWQVGSGAKRRKYTVVANACGDSSHVVTTTVYADSNTDAYELGECKLCGLYNLRAVENIKVKVTK